MACIGSEVADIVKRLEMTKECSPLGKVQGLYAKALPLATGAIQKAEELGVPVVIAILDAHGNLVFQYRMEGALLISLEVAPNKAYTAIAMQQATHTLTELVQPGGALYQLESMVQRPIVTLGGGFPIYEAGRLIGGLGISGGSLEEDMAIACAALAYI